MTTPYTDIIDLAMLSLKDYHLDKLWKQSETLFLTEMQGYLIRGIPLFSNCRKDLSDRDDSPDNPAEAHFNFQLDDFEKNILADCLVIVYLDQQILDIRQITGMMQNKTEATRYSEANLLKAKDELRSAKVERLNSQLTNYELRDADWARMVGGISG